MTVQIPEIPIMSPGLGGLIFGGFYYASVNSKPAHESSPPQGGAFVGHLTTLSSPGWDICCNRSVWGWGIDKGKVWCTCIVVYFKFPDYPNIKIRKLS